MGCGGSKFDPDEISPAGIRPFRRRIEEIRRRRHGTEIKRNNLSTKQLLDDPVNEDTSPADSIRTDCRKSVSSFAENVEPPKQQLFQEEHVKVPENDVKVEKPCSKEQEEATKKGEGEGKREEQAVTVVKEEEKKKKVKDVMEGEEFEEEEEEEEEDEEEEEEEEEEEDGEGRGFSQSEVSGPGSPSFREYYVASVRNSLDADSGDTGKGEDKKSSGSKEDKSRRKDSLASVNSSEESLCKLVKKGMKGRRFRKVLPKGKPKNLLNVRSCYNPACSSSAHESPRVLLTAEKAVS